MLMQIPSPPKGNLLKLHPDALSILFSHKRELSAVFSDVIGLLEINALSLIIVDSSDHVFSLSSTPSLEYNLFDSALWQHDGLFIDSFYQTSGWAQWQQLFNPEYYDQLDFAKLIKYGYHSSLAISQKQSQQRWAYCFASKEKQLAWHHQLEDLSKIGDYCHRQLQPLIEQLVTPTQGHPHYEKSA